MAPESVIPELTWFDLGGSLLGLGMLVAWLFRTEGGRKAWGESLPRPSAWQVSDILLIAAVFLGAMMMGGAVLGLDTEASWPRQIGGLGLLGGGQIVAAILAVGIALRRFPAGNGLNFTVVGFSTTIKCSLVYFFAGSGLTNLGLCLTVLVCRQFGYEQIQQHTLLEMMRENPPWYALIVMVLMPAVVAPVCEEIIFRGVLQNFIIGRLVTSTRRVCHPEELAQAALPPSELAGCRWWGILLTSIIFPVLHGQMQHWPALFVLSMVLGYVYERYGNLWVNILIHAWFNLVPLLAALYVMMNAPS